MTQLDSATLGADTLHLAAGVRLRDGDTELVLIRFRTSLVLPDSLSCAERAVASLVLAGRSNAEIAASRGTSPRTVANQVAAVFRKLAVNSRAELAVACAAAPVGPTQHDHEH